MHRSPNAFKTIFPKHQHAQAPLAFGTMFRRHYPQLAELGRHAASGILVAIIDQRSDQLVCHEHISGQPGTPRVLSIGRHPKVDLRLDDPSISLRHLLVLLAPISFRHQRPELRLRVLDLRTGLGFKSDTGVSLHALMTEGPLYLECGPYSLMFLWTGDADDWPEDEEDAWAMIPVPVLLDERVRSPLRALPSTRQRAARGATQVHSILQGPASCDDHRLLEPEEKPVGVLRIETAHSLRNLRVGPSALGRGILLGRDSRCDGRWLRDNRLSRVHAIALMIDQVPYMIDLATTNGTRASYANGSSSSIAISPLDLADSFELGGCRVCVSWRDE